MQRWTEGNHEKGGDECGRWDLIEWLKMVWLKGKGIRIGERGARLFASGGAMPQIQSC